MQLLASVYSLVKNTSTITAMLTRSKTVLTCLPIQPGMVLDSSITTLFSLLAQAVTGLLTQPRQTGTSFANSDRCWFAYSTKTNRSQFACLIWFGFAYSSKHKSFVPPRFYSTQCTISQSSIQPHYLFFFFLFVSSTAVPICRFISPIVIVS